MWREREKDRVRNLVPVRRATRKGKIDEKNKEKTGKYPAAAAKLMEKIPHLIEERLRGYKISTMEPKFKLAPSFSFKNAFDIDRNDLLSQLNKMQLNLDMTLKSSRTQQLEGGRPGDRIRLVDAEDLHSQPIGTMGDYQSYMASLHRIGAGPLREIEPQAAKPHAFGNPFKLDKKNMTIDEVREKFGL